MAHSQYHPLFFYGTLRSKEVRYAVLHKLESSLTLVEGFIIGYDLFKVKNTNYPLIQINKQSLKRILGFIVYYHNQEIINKLDLFEGENYSRYKAQAFKLSDTTFVMPLQFTKLIWASLIGLFFFSEKPDIWTWVGGIIIFISVVYITYREAFKKRGTQNPIQVDRAIIN